MLLKKKIMTVLNAVQANRACHQQKIKVLIKYFKEVPVEDFFDSIKGFLALIFSKSTISSQNFYVERVLEFLANFVAEVTPMDDEDDLLSDVSPHPFLTMIIQETLKYHDSVNESLRHVSCLFVKLILQHIGHNKNLNNEVCDMIQEAMLERAFDPKSVVRLQSVSALIRLQEPMNPECPAIKAYLSLMVDPNVRIRTEVVKSIAPNNVTLPQIINRLRDIDPNVRTVAFKRCADIGPINIKIIDRQQILNSGLAERNPKAKNVFIENLLPKWLSAYNEDYISFLKGLKLDADENDITNTENVTKSVIQLLLNITPVKDIISILPLNEEKIIPAEKLTSEAAALWNLVVGHLRESDTNEDYLEQIIPDLTPFCNYMKSIITEKANNKMEDWEFLDYQYILNNLFCISEGYDLSDEVGRRTLHEITLDFLRTENLQMKLKKNVVEIAYKSSQKRDDFTSTICYIISDIQESFVEKSVEPFPADEINKECQKAELKVKIIRLEADLEDALDNKEFMTANTLKIEIDQLKEKLKDLLILKPAVEIVKVTKDDPKTVCDCLDLLISILLLPNVSRMTPALVAIKDEFVVPLLNSNVGDINWRVLECLVLFCCLEKALAEEYIKIICIPIITYRTIPNYNKNALMISVKAVSDLYRLYGANIFGIMEEALIASQSTMNNTNSTSTKRRLYRSEDSDESVMLANKFHLETIIEIILDMLDDEITEIRNAALEAMAKLILDNFPVSPLLITRLVLKWYNPLTARSSDRLEQLIGVIIGNYAKKKDGAKEVIANAIIPILRSIASAPKTSPLADVDVDNLVLFLSTLTVSEGKWDLGTHLNMCHMFINEILKTKNPLMVLYLSKMLLHLDVLTENVSVIKELIAQVDTILESESPLDRIPKRNLCKFKATLETRLDHLNKKKSDNSEVKQDENTVHDATIGDSGQSKPKTPNSEKTSSYLSSITEEDDGALNNSNEQTRNSITNGAKRSKMNIESPNKNDTNATDSNSEKQTEQRQQSDSGESDTAKKPPTPKKKRRRRRKTTLDSTDHSSTSASEENQLAVKRARALDVIESEARTSDDKEAEDAAKKLVIQLEKLKENVISADSNSQELKRIPKRNKTKSSSEATSDSDSSTRRSKRINRGNHHNVNVENVKDMTVVLPDERVSRTGRETKEKDGRSSVEWRISKHNGTTLSNYSTQKVETLNRLSNSKKRRRSTRNLKKKA